METICEMFLTTRQVCGRIFGRQIKEYYHPTPSRAGGNIGRRTPICEYLFLVFYCFPAISTFFCPPQYPLAYLLLPPAPGDISTSNCR